MWMLLIACAEEPTKSPPPDSGPPTTGSALWDRLGELPLKNLVIVEVDTLRADHLTFYGHSRNTFPLTSARAGSLVVEHHYAPTSWTAPSFATLMTGVDAHYHGVRTVPGDATAEPEPILAPMFQQQLAAEGWLTWLVNGNRVLDRIDEGDGWSQASTNQGEPANASLLVRDASRFLNPQPESSFYLHLRPADPHMPWRPAPEDAGVFVDPARLPFSYEDDEDTQREKVLAVIATGDIAQIDAMAEDLRALYDEELLGIDRALDQLFDELERIGRLEETLVVLTGDHGETLFDVGDDLGHGATLRPELVRAPLVFFHPSLGTGERLDGDCVSMSQDLLPTLLPFYGIAPPPNAPWETGVPAGAGEGTAGRVLHRDGCRSFALGSLYQRGTTESLRFLSWNSPAMEVVVECGRGSWWYDLVADPGGTEALDVRGAEAEVRLGTLEDYAREIQGADPSMTCLF